MQNFWGKLQLYLATAKKLTWDSKTKKQRNLNFFYAEQEKLAFSYLFLSYPDGPCCTLAAAAAATVSQNPGGIAGPGIEPAPR